ncbi:MAG: STAS domain-containing protein [Spirochaetes bacterium]|nr:STAS domain-containing protein [Spirochaetota bacterium]
MESSGIKHERSKLDPEANVVKISGRLDFQLADQLEEKLNSLLEKKEKKIILDLTNVDYIGSSGIKVFLDISERLNQLGSSLKIVKMPEIGLKIIRAMEIEDRFDMHDSEEKAVFSY